jgi:hypothetical protein
MYRRIFKSATMNAQLVESNNNDYREKTAREKNRALLILISHLLFQNFKP